MHQCFGRTCCLHLQDKRVSQEWKKVEGMVDWNVVSKSTGIRSLACGYTEGRCQEATVKKWKDGKWAREKKITTNKSKNKIRINCMKYKQKEGDEGK
jgi:hypothetical protein